MKTLVVLLAVAALLAVALYAFLYRFLPSPPMSQPQAKTVTVTVGGTNVEARIADTDAARQQGLSGTASLPEGQGMLFIFQTPGNWAFWMKDMRYSLDIIWADSRGTVTTVDPNVSPASYPQAFSPATPDALYVLEVPAGFAAAHGIRVGDTLRF